MTSGELSRKIAIKQSAENYTFKVSKTSISSTSSASSSSFSITTNDDWKISTKESWITVSATSGSGDKNITVNLSENKTTDSRAGEISITGTNSGNTEKISVTQDGKYLTVSPSTVSFGSDANNQKVTVNTDGTFTTSKNDSWISVSTSGSSITISVTENTAKTSRSGSVTVSLSDLTSGSLSQTIAVSQAGKDYYLNVDKTSISAGSSSSSESFTITSNDTWSASSDAGWAKLSATTGSGDKTITVSIDANASTSSRSGTITVKGTNSGTKTISVSQEGANATSGYENGHEWVDLGLPSGTLWATCNIGASSPENYGDYFAWGEIMSKKEYSSENYIHFNGTIDYIIKYCDDKGYGKVDNKSSLELEDDAAYMNWGNKWRIPTYKEQNELCTECNWTWITQNGINGYKITSKINSKSIFLPAAGRKHYLIYENAGSNGFYWTSSLYEGREWPRSPRAACHLYFYDGDAWCKCDEFRFEGLPIRPVINK